MDRNTLWLIFHRNKSVILTSIQLLWVKHEPNTGTGLHSLTPVQHTHEALKTAQGDEYLSFK